MGRKAIDLIGHKFGRLTVIERSSNDKQGKPQWLCKCECGNEVIVRGYILKRGDTTSCGCLQKEKRREMNKKMWEDEDFRQTQSNRAKEQWKDDNYRQMQSDKMKEMWQNEEFKQMKSYKMKEQWQDEEFRRMQSDKGKLMSGENHPSWKGGITPISDYLRHLLIVKQWIDNCKKQVNYTCELTGKVGGELNTHHLKAFSIIVLEAHELNNIEIHKTIGEYTQEELYKLEEYIASWHKDNSNAVVLSEEVHILFHSLYGSGNNTPEQFEEFKQRYIEFKNKEGKINE